MAKKRTERENVLKNYAKQFLSFVLPLFAENKESLIKKFSDIAHFKKIFKRYMILLIVIIVALFIMLDGFGLFISSFFPNLRPGVINILIGLLLMLTAMAYSRLEKT